MVDPLIRPCVQRELRSTWRLPESVQWTETKAGVSFLQQLQLIATQAGSKRLVIMDGTTTYHPSLLQKAKEWDDESVGLVLISGDKRVGIYVFTTDAICDFKTRFTTQTGTLEESLAPLTEIHSVVPVSGCKGLVAARQYGRRPSVCRAKTGSLARETHGRYLGATEP